MALDVSGLTLEQRVVLCDALAEYAASLEYSPSQMRKLEAALMMLDELRVEVA